MLYYAYYGTTFIVVLYARLTMSPSVSPQEERVPTPRPSPAPKRQRCVEVPPKLFYSPIREEDLLCSEEAPGRCLECGTLISPHAQLCGKTICLDPPPTPPTEEETIPDIESPEPSLSEAPDDIDLPLLFARLKEIVEMLEPHVRRNPPTTP